mgnify:CR=1 FL=1
MISLGLIGCGTHCRGHHAPALSQYAQDHPDRLSLAAVCDLDRGKAEQFASACGFGAAYADYVEMLEAEILDGVVVVMPCLLYTSPSPRDGLLARMPSSA